jgi:hypothetical protein
VNNLLPAAPTSIRIRQVALCTDDIWREERRLVGELGIAAVHRDPPNVFAMRNAVFAVGDTFLEVLQPEADDAPSARFLRRHGGPAGYMLIMQVDDLDAARARIGALGVRVVHDTAPTRVHGVTASAIHLHPGDTGGTLMSFDHMDPLDAWGWAGAAWRSHVHTDIVGGIVGIELVSAEPDALTDRFAQLVGRAPSGDRSIDLDQGRVSVIAGPHGTVDHLAAVEMSTPDPARVGTTVTIAGTEIRLVESTSP